MKLKDIEKEAKIAKELSKVAVDVAGSIEDTAKALAVGTLSLGTATYLGLEARSNQAYFEDRKNAKTDYSKFKVLNHVVYAGFSQLAYLNWHKLGSRWTNKDIKSILKDPINLKDTRPDTYNNFYKEDKYYLYKYNGKEIYHAEDRRSFILYSEDINEPRLNPKFPEFGDWEFVYAYDHAKMVKTFEKDINKEKTSKRGDIRDWAHKVGVLSSGFQGSVFKNPRKKVVMIAYRGTDFSHTNDWMFTNLLLGMKLVPDSLTCAVWLYEKVATDPNLKDYEIHITGHSMGGALAQYIACYGLKPTNPTVYAEWDKGEEKPLPDTRPVAKTVTWNGLGVGTKGKIVANNDKHSHIEIYRQNYDECSKAENKILNFYLQKDLVADIQKGIGSEVVVDVVQDYDLILGGNRANYHGLMNFLPFMENGNIVRETFSENFLLNSYKQGIFDKNKREKYAKLRKENYDFKEDETENNYEIETEYEDVDSKIESEEFLAENYDYLAKDFDIPFIKEGMKLGEKIVEASAKKKSGKQVTNYFHYMIEKYSNPERTDWYEVKGDYAYIGKFNNVANVAGVEGGVPLKIKLPPKEEKIIKIVKFKEAIEIILPTIKVDKRIYHKCSQMILETHKIEYNPDRVDKEGNVLIKIPEGTYKNNFFDKKSNKFCAYIEGEESNEINLGVTFSYGRDKLISCTNPPIFSPVRGTVDFVSFNKIIIKQEAIKKVIFGEDVKVNYYHIFDHLNEVTVVQGQGVNIGDKIGLMGGQSSNGDAYAYFHHVHYSIKMMDKDFTGSICTNIEKQRRVLKNNSNEFRYINPEKFWDDGIEEGMTFNK